MSKVDPQNVYPIRGDRTRVPLIDSNKYVIAAFRVHYRFDMDEPGTHRVTPLMWEYKAVQFADNVDEMPGASLCESPSRPRGLEKVRGCNGPLDPEHDPWAWWRARARQIGMVRLATDDRDDYLMAMNEYVLPFLARAPESIRSELYELCVAAGHERRERTNRAHGEHEATTVDSNGKVTGDMDGGR